MPIIRWDPFGEVSSLLEEDFHFMPMLKAGWDLAIDIYEKNGNVIAEMNVPGIESDQLEISIEDDLLKVSGKREEKKEVKEKDYLSKEIRRGSFERIVTLPCVVDAEKTDAKFKDGVLTITMPKKAGTKEHKVRVSVHK